LESDKIKVDRNIYDTIKQANHKLLKLLLKNEKILKVITPNIDEVFFDIFE